MAILSNTSKMPGKSFSLPATQCNVGGKLAKQAGTVCFKCYALRGNYLWPNVKNAMAKRLEMIQHPNWVDIMVREISRTREKHFRWHDSGDLQSLNHLEKIVEIAKRLPEYKFWLPSKEYSLVKQYDGVIPNNLIIRMSSAKIDGKPLNGFELTSTVHTVKAYGVECEAYKRSGKCGDCRMCWDKNIPNISYPYH